MTNYGITNRSVFEPIDTMSAAADLPDDADDGEWTPPNLTPRMYGSQDAYGIPYQPYQPPQQQRTLTQRLLSTGKRVGEGAYEFGKEFLNDLNFFDPSQSGREQLFRMANAASFLIPPVGVARTAGLAMRLAVRAAEAGGIQGTLAAIRGRPVVPSAAIGAGIGGTLEFLLTRGRRFRTGAHAASAVDAWKGTNPVDFTDLGASPLTNTDWGILSAQLTDRDTIRLRPEINAERHMELGNDLRAMGYEPQQVHGYDAGSPTSETAWLVPGAKGKDLAALAKKYDQASFMTQDGLLNSMEQKFYPIKKGGYKFNSAILSDETKTQTPFGEFSAEFDQPQSVSRLVHDPLNTVPEQLQSLIAPSPSFMDKVMDYSMKSKLGTWYTKYVRSFYGLEQASKILGRAEGTKYPLEPQDYAQLAGGAATTAQHMFEFGVQDWHDRTKIVHRALKDIWSGIKTGEWDTFEQYGLARYIRALASRGMKTPLLSNGARLDPAELHNFINEVEEKLPHLKPIFDQTVSWRNEVKNQLLVQPGIISEELNKAIDNVSVDYVPLRWSQETLDKFRTGNLKLQERNITGIYSPLGHADQVRRQLEPWTGSLVGDLHSWSRLAHLQDVAGSLITKFEENDPSVVGLFADRIHTPPPELGAIQQAAIDELKSLDPLLGQLAEVKGLEAASLLAPQKLGAKGYIGAMVDVPVSYRPRGGGEAVSVKEYEELVGRYGEAKVNSLLEPIKEPQRVWYKLKDTPVGRNMAEYFQSMQPADMNLLQAISAGAAQALRAGATLSPEFLARNPFKDWFTAFITSAPHPFAMAKGFAHAMKRDDIYQKWLASGGGRANLASQDRAALAHWIDKAVPMNEKTGLGKIYNVARNFVEAYSSLSDFLENGTRIGIFQDQYEKMLKTGMSGADASRRAALGARNATVDFSIHGSRTNTVRIITAFWNAQIQGYDNMVRAFKRDPGGTALRAMASITVPSTVLYFANRDDPEYFQLPEWERSMFWHVKMPSAMPWVGDKWMRFPKPFDIGTIFGTSVEKFLEFADGVDRSAVDKMALDYFTRAAGDVLPIPTVVRPALENFANYSFLRGRPIVSKSIEDVADEYQIQPGTSELAKHIGKITKTSPIKVDNLIRGYLGGMGKITTDFGDAMINIFGKGAPLPGVGGGIDPRDTPMVRGFFSQFPRQSESVDDLFALADRVREAEYTRTNLRNTMQFDDYSDWIQNHAILLGAGGGIKKATEALKQIRTIRDMTLRDKSLTSYERNERLDMLGQIMNTIASGMQPLGNMIKEQEK